MEQVFVEWLHDREHRHRDDAGLIDLHKGYTDNRPRTWISLTKLGANALDAELKALRELVRRLSR